LRRAISSKADLVTDFVGTAQDAVATSSPGTEAETAAAAGASEQGDGVPAADAPAASIEGLDGIKIRRRPFTGPSVHHVGPFQFRLENEGNTPRNILEKIVWDKDVEVWQVRRPWLSLWSVV
jgi:indole-3-glycerol phosphate synthase